MKQTRNYGFKEPAVDLKAWTFGGGNIPDENLRENGDWRDVLPDIEIQNVNEVETFDCTGFGSTNQIESYLLGKYEIKYNYSDRALGIAAGTTSSGNDPQNVYETIRKTGLVSEQTLPFGSEIKSVNEFYSPNPLPDTVIEEGKEWLQKWDFRHEWLDKEFKVIPHEVLKVALRHSPIAVAVYAWYEDAGMYKKLGQENHWTLLVAFQGEYPVVFDSYEKKGSELKLLSPDYEFRFAKRIYIQKKTSNTAIESSETWQSLLNFIKEVTKLSVDSVCPL